MVDEYKMSMLVKESWQRRQKMLEKVEDPELKGGDRSPAEEWKSRAAGRG